MNRKLRVRVLLAVFVLLIGANLYFRLGGDSLERAMFWNDAANLDENYSAALTRTMDEIRTSTRLSFRSERSATTAVEIRRNPFVFGINRRAEAAQRQRFADLASARQKAMDAKAQAEPEVVVQAVEPAFDGEIVGILENLANGVRKAAISTDQGMQIVSEGDVLIQRYKVLQVTYGFVRFYDLSKNREIKIQVTAK